MSTKTMMLEIITPDRTVFQDDVSELVVRAVDGDLGILPNRAPVVAALQIYPVRYKKDGKTGYVAVSGGFLEMSNNKITILASAAERPEQIDKQRAEEARKRAEQRLKIGGDVDDARAEMALKRAMNRLRTVEFK